MNFDWHISNLVTALFKFWMFISSGTMIQIAFLLLGEWNGGKTDTAVFPSGANKHESLVINEFPCGRPPPQGQPTMVLPGGISWGVTNGSVGVSMSEVTPTTTEGIITKGGIGYHHGNVAAVIVEVVVVVVVAAVVVVTVVVVVVAVVGVSVVGVSTCRIFLFCL